MDKAATIKDFLAFLEEEDLHPQLNNDGDIVFQFEGRTFLVIFEEDDDQFFRLIFPNFWRIDSEDERRKAQDVALKATIQTKVAKVYVIRNHVWATIETFYDTLDHLKPVFRRNLSALLAGAGAFVADMRPE